VRLVREAGLEVRLGSELLTLRHGVTRFRITMACFEAEYAGGEFRSDFYQRGVWVAPQRLPDYPVSAPQRRLAKALLAPQRQRTLF
jgi:A/G-specific adenine glycosylase